MLSKLLTKELRGLSSTIHWVRNVNFRTRNPPDPHYDRKRMIEVCKPINLPDRRPDWEVCSKTKAVIDDAPHPYEVLLSQELKKNWDDSRMILFYHLGPLSSRTQKEVRNSFFVENLFFYSYSSNVMKLAVAGTPFTSVLHLYESSTAVVFSNEVAINKFLKVNRKVQVQGVALLAGIIDNVFYSRNQIQELGELVKKDSHLELAQFLDYVPSKFKNTINHQTQLLSHYLTKVSSEK